MNICFIGTGYVGLISGVLFSDFGNSVFCVDKDAEKISNLENGIIPIYEPGLEELVLKNFDAKRIKFTTDINNAIKKSQVIFIAVGTPTSKNGSSAVLTGEFNVAKIISKNINSYKIIVTKSTVPLGTGDKIEKILSQKNSKNLFDVVSNPEFLREGRALFDNLHPARIVVGDNTDLGDQIANLFKSASLDKNIPIICTGSNEAEAIKLFATNEAFGATPLPPLLFHPTAEIIPATLVP